MGKDVTDECAINVDALVAVVSRLAVLELRHDLAGLLDPLDQVVRDHHEAKAVDFVVAGVETVDHDRAEVRVVDHHVGVVDVVVDQHRQDGRKRSQCIEVEAEAPAVGQAVEVVVVAEDVVVMLCQLRHRPRRPLVQLLLRPAVSQPEGYRIIYVITSRKANVPTGINVAFHMEKMIQDLL